MGGDVKKCMHFKGMKHTFVDVVVDFFRIFFSCKLHETRKPILNVYLIIFILFI